MANTHNSYIPIRATLETIIDESPQIKSFVLKPEESIPFKTGEFVELTLDGFGEAPFTPSSSPFTTDKLEITIMKAGYVTSKIHALHGGEIMGIRGPFGKGYPVEKFYNKEVLIIGGGCGLAPIRSLLYSLVEEKEKFKKVILCYGSKTPKDCIYKPLFKDLNKIPNFESYRSVDIADEAWEGHVGVVTQLLDHIQINPENAIAVVCGPPIMMKFSTLRLLELGYQYGDIYLSLEKNMSCGLGKCGHCMMGKYFACKDGPVFTYEEVMNIPDWWK